MKFSKVELQHIFRAWVVISLSFAMLQSGGFSMTSRFFVAVAISAFTVGVGFLLHELMHKYLAQRYGCSAEFRAFDFMLVVAFLMALFRSPIFFAAPGAVFIAGNVNPARNGRISAAGPMVNVVLAAVFIGMELLLLSVYPSQLLLKVAAYGASVNAWLAVFNMLPFFGLDGNKVLHWNTKVYAGVMALAVGIMAATYFV